MTKATTQKEARTYDFGFDAHMRAADWVRFPAWYDNRCLLPLPWRAASTADIVSVKAAQSQAQLERADQREAA